MNSDLTTDPVVLADRYDLVEVIGEGGVGVVWRAHDRLLGRDVAVKRLRADFDDDVVRDRFHREAVAAAALEHPALVTVYDIGDEGGHAFLVMELVDGPSVADLAGTGPLPPDSVAAIGAAIAGALGVAHDAGLVHRDVKPANVLVAPHGHPKLADFGVAKAVGAAQAALTTPGTLVGTAGYLAPEQVEGGPVDGRTDVYALGLLLHECLTGRRVFGTGTLAEVASRRLADDVAPPSTTADVPPELDAVVARATRRDPDARYPHGRALAEALAPLTPADADRRLRALVNERSRRGGHDETAVLTLPATATGRRRGAPMAPDNSAEAPERPGPDPGTDEPERSAPTWQMVLVPAVILAVLVGLALTLGGGSSDAGDDGDGPPADAPLTIAAASDVDPPPGDGEEHAEDVPLAHDGDESTGWTTEHYDGPDLGGLKPGVGLAFDLGENTEVGEVALSLGIPGADLALYAVDGDVPQDSAAWGDPVATVSDAPESTSLDVADGAAGRTWILWFTRLGSDGDRYRATVQEVAFLR